MEGTVEISVLFPRFRPREFPHLSYAIEFNSSCFYVRATVIVTLPSLTLSVPFKQTRFLLDEWVSGFRC